MDEELREKIRTACEETGWDYLKAEEFTRLILQHQPAMRQFSACKTRVYNRGVAPDSFLNELIDWARTAPEEIFAPNTLADIYSKVKPELGPWTGQLHRTAGMLEVMRVLALFESGCDWTEGVDTSRLGADSPENSEAGAWQISYDARLLATVLRVLLRNKNIRNGIEFQRAMKFDHPFAMEFVARLLRHNTKHNGPLYKGAERLAIRKSLRAEHESIYPYLSRASVAEFQAFLA